MPICLPSFAGTTSPASGGAVNLFNVTTRNTNVAILASTPSNPSGEANIAFSTDINDFYIYDGSDWVVYNPE